MPLLRSTFAFLAAVACAGVLLVADSASFFLVSSYSIAWLFGGAFALGLWWTTASPAARWERWARPVPVALVLAVVAVLPLRDPEHKAFYRAYERIDSGMTLTEVREILRGYDPARSDAETLTVRFSPDPATVEYVRVELESGRVVDKAYLWD